jgi:mannan endo-1,4-beta-mannosidase
MAMTRLSAAGLRLDPQRAALIDSAGQRLLPRGLNMTHAWGDLDQSIDTIPHLARTGANCVRAVFGTFAHSCGKSSAVRERVTRAYLDAGLTPIVEDHDATCKRDTASLAAVVDSWLEPDNLRWLGVLHDRVILNIANEWGPPDERWCAAYIDAITRLREAGVRNVILIDAPGCGQEVGPVVEFAGDVFLSDSMRNTLFAVHLYQRWHTEGREGTSSMDARSTLREARDVVRGIGSDLIVGEFSSRDVPGSRYDDARLLEIFDELDLGWLAWSWNQNDKRSLDMATGWRLDEPPRDLTPFGRRVVEALRGTEA